MESASTPSVGDVSSGTSNSYTDRIEVHEINEIPGDILIMNVDRMPDLRLPSTNGEPNPLNRACESNGGAPQLGNPDRSMQGSSAGEEDQRETKRVKTLQQDEPSNETRVVLCVFPKTPGCTPAGRVLPEDSQGPATSGTTPTARSSKRACENLIGAPAQSQKGKTFHSYVNEIGIDIGSPAKKFKLSDWGGRNNGQNDDVHIQETSDAVEHIEIVGRRDEKIDGIELGGGVENIGPVEEILEDIMPVERIAENIGPIEGEIIGPVERIVENIGPVERTGEDTIEEIGNIGPVGGSVKDIAGLGMLLMRLKFSL
ncbi:hypothetical protein QAD02_007960 [Eretmocerus hayati]|uniref:Uncharacterized protein n=1 Tax=Eretmocerus hayati TaxID=131215 RepID=A0ACC2N5R1_9HYME|nr:hypothetical protein QAD02_007960 [Eretmocerus hayati]